MIIFHGSNAIIEKPIYEADKPYNDYGLGFYCTESLEMAKEWGVSVNTDGYANCYEIDTNGLKIFDLSDQKYCILHWLAILLENRTFDITAPLALEGKEYLLKNFMPDYKNYDIMIGYRADDSYFSFAEDFLNGTISYRQLNNAMRLGKLGLQFVLKSKEAFDRLKFLGYEFAPQKEWYAKRLNRDREARKQYFDVEKNKRQKGDLYITQILDEEMKPGDECLQ